MRIAIVDTYYPDFLSGLPKLTGTYAEELAKVLALAFGTSDFYSRNLSAIGWDAVDIIANHADLQNLWAREHNAEGSSLGALALQQIHDARPDVVFMQDLSFFDAATLRFLKEKYLLAGQCSCPMPRSENVSTFDVLFTSFPHYVGRFAELGVRGEYLPLAFEHTLLDRIPPQERDIDVSFVGGLGASLHWKAGTAAFENLAAAIGLRFHWYGYGWDRMARESPLRQCYRGQAWGLDMYRIYGRSKIVVNRHGEVSLGYSNNLRMYEASGMGALLVTEASNNIESAMGQGVCVEYLNPNDLVRQTTYHLTNIKLSRSIASRGHTKVLADHSYAHRMVRVSEVLTECLKRRAA